VLNDRRTGEPAALHGVAQPLAGKGIRQPGGVADPQAAVADGELRREATVRPAAEDRTERPGAACGQRHADVGDVTVHDDLHRARPRA
jgi:hypothetical protein